MPGFDGTGPLGRGPMTGRCMGRCAGARTGAGFGAGRGLGAGRGFASRAGRYSMGWSASITKEQEIGDLKAERELMQKELDEINKRLSELENNVHADNQS